MGDSQTFEKKGCLESGENLNFLNLIFEPLETAG